MLNLFTIATRASAISEILNVQLQATISPLYQARPGMEIPVILMIRGKPVLATAHWGCATEAATMSLNTFPTDRVLTQRPFNTWIHTQRCLIPANCFFARRSGKQMQPDDHSTYLIRILQSRLFLMGGLYHTEVQRNGRDKYALVLLTTGSADILRSLSEEMPVLLSRDLMLEWLTAEHLADIMHLADRSGDHWFDYFPVSDAILTPGVNSRQLLKPLDMSMHERDERLHKLKAGEVKQDRFDRRGGKW
jgi:putative SOS response-associated peptidase YedK